MSQANYEQYQLELIAAEYRSRGYSVDVGKQSQDRSFTFDAVAQRPGSAEIIIIELVNRSRASDHAMQRRAEEIARLFGSDTDARLDMRYIDQPDSRELYARDMAATSILATDDRRNLEKVLRTRLPLMKDGANNAVTASKNLMGDWALMAMTIRLFVRRYGAGIDGDSILDMYNSLLQRFDFCRGDDEDGQGALVQYDFFELHEEVHVVVEGGVADYRAARDARRHLISLRRQMLKYIKHNSR